MLDSLVHYLSNPFNSDNLIGLINLVGYIGLIIIVYSETGLLVGFFLPGDSLLVTAGLLAATPKDLSNPEAGTILNIYILLCTLIPATILGDATGYLIGNKTGPKLFKKEQSLFFRKDYLIKTHEFYEKHGGKTIIIAKFVPIIRTFAATVAGVANMKYTRFLRFNVMGAVTWITSMTLLGYFLGSIPGVAKHIEKVIIIVVLLSISPAIYKWITHRIKKSRVKKTGK
ncbi:MAG: hypothetical protein FJ216_05100 [Ignavibacteria bacterium]|nr:hypothetical protein [Ignavibacteria bacterium]